MKLHTEVSAELKIQVKPEEIDTGISESEDEENVATTAPSSEAPVEEAKAESCE